MFLLINGAGAVCAEGMSKEDLQAVGRLEEDAEARAGVGNADYARLRLTDVWKHATGRGVNVAIFDYTGVNPYDPAIRPNVKGVYDARTGSTSWGDVYDGSSSHGTNCAKSLLGVAPGVNLYIVKLSYESNVIDGLSWARSKGCRVVSFSGWTYKNFDQEEYNAIQEAYTAAKSVLLCASGGNTGKKEYHYPASHTNTLCVGAATYSAGQNQYVVIPKGTYNDRMDLVAPGSSTSGAAPVAAGTAALLFQAKPAMTARECHNILRNTALDLGIKGKDLRYGYGLIQPYKALEKIKNIGATSVPVKKDTKVYAKSLKISNKKLDLYVGQSKKLTCKRMPSNSRDKITWSSSRSSVASVDARGKVKAKNVGDAVITAKTAKGVKAICKVTVYPAMVNGQIQNYKNGKVLHGRLLSKWKRNAKATGYIVQIATDKNFTRNLKSKKITRNKTVSYEFTGLKKGRGYYWRIRSYKNKGGYVYYSGWVSTSSPVYVR